jgi:hypothetical protein
MAPTNQQGADDWAEEIKATDVMTQTSDCSGRLGHDGPLLARIATAQNKRKKWLNT